MPDDNSALEILRQSGQFARVPEEELGEFARGFEPRSFSAGDIAVKEGDRGREIYLILEGNFDVKTCDADGCEHLNSLGAGAMFGEMAALTGGRRFATVQAVTDAKVLVNAEAQFHEILQSSKALSEAILSSLDKYI